jgi:hypothetical protein
MHERPYFREKEYNFNVTGASRDQLALMSRAKQVGVKVGLGSSRGRAREQSWDTQCPGMPYHLTTVHSVPLQVQYSEAH